MKHEKLTRTKRPYPDLTCVNCGKTKKATQFPKRGGLTYEKMSPLNPKRYARQCKLCMKPVPANAGDDYEHKEPVNKARSIGTKKGLAKKKKKTRKKRSDASGLSPAELKQKTRIETRIKSMLYLSERGCECCGERDPRKLEYDHKNPANKHRGISRLITDGYSWSSAVLRREIRKCRILCANCHRVHTIKQQGYYASPEVQNSLQLIADDYEFTV